MVHCPTTVRHSMSFSYAVGAFTRQQLHNVSSDVEQGLCLILVPVVINVEIEDFETEQGICAHVGYSRLEHSEHFVDAATHEGRGGSELLEVRGLADEKGVDITQMQLYPVASVALSNFAQLMNGSSQMDILWFLYYSLRDVHF